jgi:hypothetical protein
VRAEQEAQRRKLEGLLNVSRHTEEEMRRRVAETANAQQLMRAKLDDSRREVSSEMIRQRAEAEAIAQRMRDQIKAEQRAWSRLGRLGRRYR